MANPAANATGHLAAHGMHPCVVTHGATAGTARPAIDSASDAITTVWWVGSVAPTNAVTGDHWTDTANLVVKRYNGTSWDTLGGSPISDNTWLGKQNLGDASHEAMIQWWGNGTKVQWQTAVDVANTPTYSDLVLAAHATAWNGAGQPTAVEDFLILRNGTAASNPSRLGIGTYPTDASNGTLPTHPGMLEVGIYGTTNGATFTNIVANIRTTAPAQTGFAFAAIAETGKALWSVGTDGTVKIYDSVEAAMVTLSPSAGVASTHDVTSATEIRARFGDSSNVTIMGEVGPASQPGVQVVNAGTTWYRASDYHWQTPGYVTIDRNVSVGGSGLDAEVIFTVNGHGATQSGDLTQWLTNAVVSFAVTAAGLPKWTAAGNQSIGSGSALLGANCPATTVTAPYKWLKAVTSDGSTVYIPGWK